MVISTGQRMLAWTGRIAVIVILGFLLCPTLVVTIAAFNAKSILAFPPESWSLRWFAKALAYDDFRSGFHNGLIVTLWASAITLIVGAAFAFVIDRYRFAGRAALEALLLSPLIIPHFTIGLGLLILTAQLGLGRGFVLVVVTHVILALPFVMRSVYVSLRNLDPRLELAAASLGASPGRVLLTVTLPLLLPGLVSGWLFAAILSFNEFTASLFVTVQRTQTLPVVMYNYVREFADPSMAAVSVLYIALTATLLIIANLFLGLGKVLNVQSAR
jgi:putative spermidine/putrescine transport system permease protein